MKNFLSKLWSSIAGSQRNDVEFDRRLTVGSPSGFTMNWTLKLVSVLAILLTLGIGNAWGVLSSPYTCTFTAGMSMSGSNCTTGDVTWTVSTTVGKGSPTTTFGNQNGQSCIKLGSGKNTYYSAMTLTTSAFASYNVTSVVIYASSNNGGSKTFRVTQGATQIGTGSQTFSSNTWVTNITRNTTAGSGGNLSIEISSDATATFIHSIQVTYTAGSCTKLSAPGSPSSTPHETSVDLSWNSVANSTGYLVTFDGTEYNIASGTTNKTITGLKKEKTYAWTVAAKGDGSTYCALGNATSEQSVTTLDGCSDSKVIYTVASTSSVTPTDAPAGTSASYSSTYGTVYQLTNGNSMTLTLSGYAGKKIKGLTLDMRSNGAAGAGTFSMVIGSTTVASISDATGFNAWYDNDSYGTDYRKVHVTLSDEVIVGSGENIVITIAATTNSLYCQGFALCYSTCTPLGSINGSVNLTTDGCGAGELKATWKMSATTGIASQTLRVYDENLEEVTDKRITGITASTSNQTKTISGLNPCKEYYVTVENVSSGGDYCAAQDPWESSVVTTLGYTYTITKTNVSLKGGETEAPRSCEDFMAEYVANDGYFLPASITVTGASYYEWDSGVLMIDKADVTGDVTVLITGIPASNFENGATVFIQAESSSAWDASACVKAWFNNSGAGGAAQTTYWLFDATGGDSGKKLFATVVPSTGDLNQVTLQRFASNCSDFWNNNGTLTKASDGGSNTFRSTGSGTSNVAWNGSGITLSLFGTPNSWGSSLGTFVDQGAGVWTATYNNYTPSATSAEFKVNTNYNGWIGHTGSNDNATLSGMIVGSTYNVTATLNVTTHALTMSKTFVKGTVHFDLQGHGSAISDLTNVAANSKISAPSPAPTDAEYNFAGWYKEVGCTNAWDFASDQVTETMTLYAKWTTKPKYTITYEVPSCATVSPTSAQTNITQDAAIGTLPTPSAITDYTFYGWSLSEQTSETDAAPAIINSSYVPTGNTTLYAVYSRTIALKNTFTLVEDDEFISGADYVIAAYYSSNDYAIKAAVKSSYYIDQTQVNNDGTISNPAADIIWCITVENALSNTVSLYNANTSKYLDIITNGSHKNLVLDASKKTFIMSSNKEGEDARTFGFESTTTSGYYIHKNTSYDEFDAGTSSSATSSPYIYLYKRDPNVFYTTAACKVQKPTFSPVSGTMMKPGSNTVTITCGTASASIYYTTDGTTPTSSSTPYTGSFILGEGGTVKAIATKAGMDDSDVATATYTWGKDFSLATSSYVPEEGDEIIIVNYNSGSPNKALSTTQNNNNRGQTSVTLNAGKIEVPDGGDVQVITLEDGENGNWLFNVGTNAYLYAAGNNNNYLKTSTKAVVADNGIWTITIAASTSTATIKANGTNNPYLRYNGTNSLFSCYGSATTQDDIRLYYYRYPVSPKTLEPFEYAVGYGPSQVQAVTVKAYDLNGNITVTCPTNYELSTSPNSGFSTSNLTLTRDGSNTVNTKFYVRMAAGLAIGSYPGTMTISGGGMAAESRNLTGSVGAAPSGTNYTLVTDEEDIFPGDEIVILNASGTLLMSNKAGSNNYKAAQAPENFTQMGATVFTSTSSDSIQNIIVEACDDEWLFKVGDNYLYAPSASNNQLKASTITYATNGNGQWKAEINHVTGEALVFAPNSANRDTMQFNGAVFSCYANAQYGYIKLYAKPSATANVCGSPSKLTDFETTYSEGASTAQSFKVKGRNLTSDITVTAPTGYEVCLTEGGTYTASVTLTRTDGKVASTTVYVRLKAVNEAGTYNGNITITATGATTRNIAVTGTVAPNPEITLTGDPLLVTSRNEMNIMATNTLTLNIRGARAGQTVSISGTGLKFYKNDGTHYVDLSSTALTAPVTDQVVYVSYNPTSAGTGAVATPDITVTCDGGSETFSGKIKVRNLPDAVAIVAKVNGVWQALPANISSASNPAPVQVSVATDGGVKKAYGASTLAYKLWPVKTTNGIGDRFGTYSSPSALNAAMVRFAGNSNKGLWANDNKSTNTINNNAVITEVISDVTTGYEWTITTTEVDGQFVYNLTSTHGSNTNDLRLYSNKWGTYGSTSGTNELYILPLVEVQDAALTVMEWSTNEMAVSYPNGGSVASGTFKAMIGEGDKTTVTATSLGGDMYKLTGVGNLQANPGKVLTLSMTESSIAKQAVFTIPLIVTAEKTEAQLCSYAAGGDGSTLITEGRAIASSLDVIIRNGGRLTTGTAQGHFKDLYIYPGGKAKITKNFVAANVYMRGGYSFLDNKATYLYPDLCVQDDGGTATVTTAGVKYDLYVDNRYYYTFSMPYDVALTDVHDETGSDAFNVWVKHYNGETRASGTHVSGWEWYGDEPGQGSFFAGIGYEITAKPRVSGRPVAIIRFPVKSGNITTDASREIGVSVNNYGYDDYGSGSLAANNVGWNFVGNPYLTEYKAGTASPGNANDTLMLVDQGYEKHIDETTGVWDGTYDWKSSNKRFITVPYDTQTDYHSEYVATYTIPAFSAFFIQTTASGTFYMRGSRPQAVGVAPRFGQAAKEKPELHIDILLSGEGESVEGKAGLLIHDKYEGGLKDFEDVEQWFVEQNELKTYTFAGGTALAYNLTDEQTVQQPIPMGYIATVAGEHTYTINEANDVSSLAHLWLTDNETGMTTDLLVRDYTFTTDAGRYDERFTITAEFEREEVYTDVTDTGGSDWAASIGVYHDGNTLTLRGLPENSAVYVYDMTGKLMASDKQLNNVVSLSIAAQGVSNIRVVNGQNAVTLRSVIR